MAGVDVGSGGSKRRSTNTDVNMIPFIDLLFVTVAFLLITAVWSTNGRLATDAQGPGKEGCQGECSEPVSLHVTVEENGFALQWKQGKTLVSESRLPKQEYEVGGGVRYTGLSEAIAKEWMEHRSHSDPADRKTDLAVLHSDDRTTFRELVAVLDAVHGTQRDMRDGEGRVTRVPAFATTFAVR